MIPTDLQPLRVLIIEDSEDDARLLLRQLARSQYACEHRRVETPGGLAEALRDGPWDIILSDHSMPAFSAPEALGITRANGADIPFVVVSGSIGDEQAVAVMKAGAHDYIMKDNLARLAPVVDRELREAKGRAGRRRAEDSLRENEAMFRALSASSPLGVYMTDTEGRVTYVNPRACEIFRIPPSEAMGNTWLQRLSPEDRPRAWADWRSYVKQGGLGEFTAEHRLRFPGEPDRWIRTRVSPARDGAAPMGFVGTIEDITDQKISQIALRESEEYNRRLVEEARDVIFSVAPDTVFTALNPAFVAVTGWPVGEWLGKSFLPLIHPADLPVAMAKLQQVLGGGEPAPFELRIQHKEGDDLICELTATPRTRDGRIVGVNGIARDVTRRKQREEQQQQSRNVEATGNFAGRIALDLTNILSIILGYGDLALGQLGKEDHAHSCVQEILSAAERAVALNRQLLAFSRQLPLHLETLYLNDTILQLGSRLRRIIGEDRTFHFEPGEDLPPVMADLSQLEQVVLHLVINARDATEAGGAIRIETARVVFGEGDDPPPAASVPPGDYCAFSVIDDGRGMSPEVRARLFEPFFTTKPEGQGIGLGLSAVHGIVKQCGGEISVASRPDAGSTITVYLPALVLEEEEGEGEQEEPGAAVA